MRCDFRLISIVLIVIADLLSGCKPDSINNSKYRNDKYAWVSESFHGEGHWMRITSEGDPTPDGYYTMFYHDGVIHRNGRILNGDDVDTSFQFDIHGKLQKYRLEDSLLVIDYYINDGDVKLYFPSGELLLEGIVENHSLKGPSKAYFKDGTLNRITSWDNFRENGKTTYFFTTGELSSVCYWENGIQHGSSVYYYKSGQMYKESFWVNGKEHGLFKLYHRNGSLLLEAYIQYGKMEGVEKTYYPEGSLRSKSNVKSDKLSGIRYRYYKNGRIFSQVEYSEGKPHGKGVFFTHEGLEYGNHEYKNGQALYENWVKELNDKEQEQIDIFNSFNNNDYYLDHDYFRR